MEERNLRMHVPGDQLPGTGVLTWTSIAILGVALH